MLVLSRKSGQQIVIADNIVITVVEIRSDRVRLGIEAPREIPIHRKEVFESIEQAKREEDSGASDRDARGAKPTD